MKDKYQEALDLICDESYKLDIFLEKYPQIQMNWNNSKDFHNHIKKITAFENKYGQMPAGILQELVDKKTPMKPLNRSYTYDRRCGRGIHKKLIKSYLCPICNMEVNRRITYDKDRNYCPYCGQRLDWSDK